MAMDNNGAAAADKGPSSGRQAQEFVKAAADFEKSKINEIKLSRKIAWGVAGGAFGLAVLAVLALIITVYNHKEPQPLVLEADKTTGEVTMLRAVKDATNHYSEVVDKYWVGLYVRQYEGYDWFTIAEQFDAVKLMSADSVAAEYALKVQDKNGPLTLFQDKAKVSVKIISVTPLENLMQVRFSTQRLAPNGENLDQTPVQNWIATLAYKYDSGMMTDQQRLINPLGFKVLTYRVDPELSK